MHLLCILNINQVLQSVRMDKGGFFLEFSCKEGKVLLIGWLVGFCLCREACATAIRCICRCKEY